MQLALVAAMSMVLLMVAAAMWHRLDGKIPALSCFTLASLCVVTAIAGFFDSIANRKTYHLDISGIGQIRLNEYRQGAAANRVERYTDIEGGGEVVQLLGDSTLWPMLLLLRLQKPSGRVAIVHILPDCLDRKAFRTVCVACHWIAAQNNRPAARLFEKNPHGD
jgi:hypothetical protein